MFTRSLPLALAGLALLTPAVAGQSVSFPFHESFEAPVLSPAWTVTQQWGNGTAELVGDPWPAPIGSQHLLIQGPPWPDFQASNVTLDLRVDLTGVSGVQLSFQALAVSGPPTPVVGTWLGGLPEIYEGVFVSDDGGSSWVSVFEFAELALPFAAHQEVVVDLDKVAAAQGLTYTSDFLVRFSWLDDEVQSSDVLYLDEIALRTAHLDEVAELQSPAPVLDGHFGRALVLVPDLDGDGLEDLAIGVPGIQGGRGRVELVSSATHMLLDILGPGQPGEGFGETLARLDDLDGDGVDELLVGAPGSDVGSFDGGAAYVLSLPTKTTLHSFFGATGDALGAAICRGPDLNGDGIDELVIAAPLRNGSFYWDVGRVEIHDGSSFAPLVTITGVQSGEHLGASVALGGDLDADGLRDLIVGAPMWDVGAWHDNTGRAFVFSSGTGLSLLEVSSYLSGGRLGSSVIGVGDVDGDGVEDFAVGQPGGTGQEGGVHVFSGTTGSLLTIVEGEGFDERLGASLADASGFDGPAAIAVGNGPSPSTRVVVLSLPGLEPLVEYRSDVATDEGGPGLAMLGDRDQNGFAELGVGQTEELAVLFPAAGRVHIIATKPRLTGITPSLVHATVGGSVTLALSGVPDGPAELVVGPHVVPVNVLAGSAGAVIPPLGAGSSVDLHLAALVRWQGPAGMMSTQSLPEALTIEVPTIVGATPGAVPFDVPTAVIFQLEGNQLTSGLGTVRFHDQAPVLGTWFSFIGTTFVSAISPVLPAPGNHPVELELTVGGVTEYTRAEADAVVFLGPGILAMSTNEGYLTGGELLTFDLVGFEPGTPVGVSFDGVVVTGTPVGFLHQSQLTVTTPPGNEAGPVDLVLTQVASTGTVTSTNPDAFTYVLPTVTSFSHGQGPQAGGQVLTAVCSGFLPGPATLRFGSITAPAAITGPVGQQTLTCTTPKSPFPHSSFLTVVQGPNEVFTWIDYKFKAPVITGASPAAVAWYDPANLTIHGSNFAPNVPATVTIDGGAPLVGTVVSDSAITVSAPAGHLTLPGPLGVTVDQAGVLAVEPSSMAVTPSLGLLVSGSAALGGVVRCTIESKTLGVAVIASAAGQVTPVPLSSIFHGLALDPASLVILAVVPLTPTGPDWTLAYPPGLLLPQTALSLQAFVTEATPLGSLSAFTNAVDVVVP